jgi:hypothetical protein
MHNYGTATILVFSKGKLFAFDIPSASFIQLATLDEKLGKVSIATTVEESLVFFSGGMGVRQLMVTVSRKTGEKRKIEEIRNKVEKGKKGRKGKCVKKGKKTKKR